MTSTLGIPIVKTLELNYCWVTGLTNKQHEHHVIPRAYGGENGPTVTLNADVHNLLHDCHKACTSKAGKKKYDLVVGQHVYKIKALAHKNNPNIDLREVHTKFMYLLNCIISSQNAANKSVNKKQSGFDAVTHNKLTYLTKTLKKSQKDVINLAIDNLYTQLKGGKL